MAFILTMHATESQNPYEIVAQLLKEFLVLSFFFVVWNWSVRHFRAHWHHFIEIAYRTRALDVLRRMQLEGESEPDRQELRRIEATLLLLYGETAYLESEPKATLEKIFDLEEQAREEFSGTKRT